MHFEILEARDNPSVIFDGLNNVLTVTGDANANALYVNWAGGSSITVKVDGVVTVVSDPAINASTKVELFGLGGSDNIQMVGSLESEIHGGDGNDVITGGIARDIIFGEAGDDNIQGGAGDDVLVGGTGRDRLSGGSGLDIEVGGEFVNPLAYDFAALKAISVSWAAGSPDPTLAGGWLGLISDTEVDRFTAGTEADWFLGQTTDLYTDYVVWLDLRTGPGGGF